MALLKRSFEDDLAGRNVCNTPHFQQQASFWLSNPVYTLLVPPNRETFSS